MDASVALPRAACSGNVRLSGARPAAETTTTAPLSGKSSLSNFDQISDARLWTIKWRGFDLFQASADFWSRKKSGFDRHFACFPGATMDEIKASANQLRKTQAPVALRSLQAALAEHIEDMNRRLQAGLAIRETQTAFEVHEVGKMDTLLRVSLTGENNFHYTQFVRRQNEMQSGVIYVRVGQDGVPSILFSDFPHPNVQVSYQDASKRLLNSSF